MKRVAIVLLVLAAVVAGTWTAVADEDAAKYFTSRGRKALEEKNLAEAERQFNKAVSEWKTHAPAILGLAEVAIARNDDKQAIDYLATCLKLRESAAGSEEGLAAVKRAEELLKKLDRPRYDYRQLVDRYVADLMKLAKSSLKENRDLARRCAERVLLVDPEHAEAKAVLEEAGPAPAKEAAEASSEKNVRQLFNGENLDNWFGVGDVWRVADGIVTARTGGDAYGIRSKERAEGDYTVTFEMRTLQDTSTPPMIGMAIAYRGEYERQVLNVFTNAVAFVKQKGTHEDKEQLWRTEPQLIKGGFDRKE
ncbi:MAG: tetratricopeptide repeat protein, partial [Planctomycetota bacterium]